MSNQFRMTDGSLLDAQGQLIEKGYQTRLSRAYDRRAIRAGALRIKEWDYYCVTSGSKVLALTIADNSYMGLDSISLLDVETGWQHTRSIMRAFPMGKTGLPATSAKGDVCVSGKDYFLRFQNDGHVRVLDAQMGNFQPGKALKAHLVLTDEPEDSMVIATPFAGKPRHFYYNQKINCLSAEGEVVFDGQVYPFRKEDSMAVLDWGRGVWTYKNTWYWSSLSARIDGVPFGFNLGYGFGDVSAASENMLFYGGKAFKLDKVEFRIPKTPDGRDDFLKPWSVADNEGRLNLTFTPALDRASLTSALVIESDQHQVFGYFDGDVLFGDTPLHLTHLLGFAEKVRNKW